MNGMGNGIFAPDGSATRGMVVTILYRMAGEPRSRAPCPFTDVKEGQYYAKAVTWAYENGIAMGMTDTLFAPNCAATREQIVTFLYRYAQLAGLVCLPEEISLPSRTAVPCPTTQRIPFPGRLEQDSW